MNFCFSDLVFPNAPRGQTEFSEGIWNWLVRQRPPRDGGRKAGYEKPCDCADHVHRGLGAQEAKARQAREPEHQDRLKGEAAKRAAPRLAGQQRSAPPPKRGKRQNERTTKPRDERGGQVKVPIILFPPIHYLW